MLYTYIITHLVKSYGKDNPKPPINIHINAMNKASNGSSSNASANLGIQSMPVNPNVNIIKLIKLIIVCYPVITTFYKVR